MEKAAWRIGIPIPYRLSVTRTQSVPEPCDSYMPHDSISWCEKSPSKQHNLTDADNVYCAFGFFAPNKLCWKRHLLPLGEETVRVCGTDKRYGIRTPYLQAAFSVCEYVSFSKKRTMQTYA